MEIRNIQYRLRRRRLDEVFDFALLVLRTHLARFILYAAPGFLLLVGFNISLLILTDSVGESFWSARHLSFLLLVLAEQPLFALPLVLLNGNLVFDSRPPVGQVFGGVLRLLPGYFLRAFVWRTALLSVLAPSIVAVWRGAVHQFFLAEVLLLERLRGRDVGRRLGALTRVRAERTVAFLLLDVTLAICFVVCAGYAYNLLLGAVGLDDVPEHWRAGYDLLSPITHIFVFAYLVFHSTAKFLFYLDLRSQSEGWDVELMLLKGVQDTEASRGGVA